MKVSYCARCDAGVTLLHGYSNSGVHIVGAQRATRAEEADQIYVWCFDFGGEKGGGMGCRNTGLRWLPVRSRQRLRGGSVGRNSSVTMLNASVA
jgi:hypothetical protein